MCFKINHGDSDIKVNSHSVYYYYYFIRTQSTTVGNDITIVN